MKRVKLDSIYLVINPETLRVVGCGLDVTSAWRDAAESCSSSRIYDARSLIRTGRYVSIEATANATYDPQVVKENFERLIRELNER